MATEPAEYRVWILPGQAARLLGVDRVTLAGFGFTRMDVRAPGASVPQWRYAREEVLAFIAARTSGGPNG